MIGSRRNTWLAVAVMALGLSAFPFSYSEAQSADIPLLAVECEELSHSALGQMSEEQREVSRQCDMVEASHDWEQQYGNLNESELSAGIVYE